MTDNIATLLFKVLKAYDILITLSTTTGLKEMIIDGETGFHIPLIESATKPILNEMMTSDETAWLNDYHQTVYEKLATHLSDKEKELLKRKTKTV